MIVLDHYPIRFVFFDDLVILVAHGFGAELRQPAKIYRVIQDTAHRSVIPQMTAVANGIRLADQAVIVVGRNGNVIRIQDICDRPDIVSCRPQLKNTAYYGGTCRLDHGRVLAVRSLEITIGRYSRFVFSCFCVRFKNSSQLL